MSQISYGPTGATGINNADLIYRQGAQTTDISNIIGSWTEVISKINSTNQTIDLYIDNSLGQCVADIDCDLSRVNITSVKPGLMEILLVADGTQLHNAKKICGSVTLVGLCITQSALRFDNERVFVVENGAVINNHALSTVPMVEILTNHVINIKIGFGSFIQTLGNPLIPLFNIGTNGTLVIDTVVNVNSDVFPNNWVSSTDNSGNLIISGDASVITNISGNNVGFLGTITNNGTIDNAEQVKYDDNKNPTTLLGDNVQSALDNLKSGIPSLFPIYAPTGTNMTPQYSFIGFPTDGMYRSESAIYGNGLSFTSNAINFANIFPSGINVPLNVCAEYTAIGRSLTASSIILFTALTIDTQPNLFLFLSAGSTILFYGQDHVYIVNIRLINFAPKTQCIVSIIASVGTNLISAQTGTMTNTIDYGMTLCFIFRVSSVPSGFNVRVIQTSGITITADVYMTITKIA